MRIRKNFKISSLFYTAAPGTVIRTYDCQLNQSPWDVMSFSSPSNMPLPQPSQFNGNDACAEINGSSFDSISVSRSASEKTEQYESVTDQMAEQPVNEAEKSDDMPIICCKTNGRNWHCHKKAMNGTSFCQHPLSQVKNYTNNLAHSTTKKQAIVVPEGPKRRGRPRKQAPVPSSNPNEYYYYMGFCPSGRKKKGESSSQDTDIEMVDGAGEKRPSKVPKFADDYLDSNDDEDEEEDEAKRKRARKPVKARSLKSLM